MPESKYSEQLERVLSALAYKHHAMEIIDSAVAGMNNTLLLLEDDCRLCLVTIEFEDVKAGLYNALEAIEQFRQQESLYRRLYPVMNRKNFSRDIRIILIVPVFDPVLYWLSDRLAELSVYKIHWLHDYHPSVMLEPLGDELRIKVHEKLHSRTDDVYVEELTDEEWAIFNEDLSDATS